MEAKMLKFWAVEVILNTLHVCKFFFFHLAFTLGVAPMLPLHTEFYVFFLHVKRNFKLKIALGKRWGLVPQPLFFHLHPFTLHSLNLARLIQIMLYFILKAFKPRWKTFLVRIQGVPKKITCFFKKKSSNGRDMFWLEIFTAWGSFSEIFNFATGSVVRHRLSKIPKKLKV